MSGTRDFPLRFRPPRDFILKPTPTVQLSCFPFPPIKTEIEEHCPAFRVSDPVSPERFDCMVIAWAPRVPVADRLALLVAQEPNLSVEPIDESDVRINTTYEAKRDRTNVFLRLRQPMLDAMRSMRDGPLWLRRIVTLHLPGAVRFQSGDPFHAHLWIGIRI